MNLESFFFLFDLDSSGLKKGVEQGSHDAKKLAHDLSLADKATHHLKESFSELATMGLAAFGGFFAAEKLIEGVNETTEAMGKLVEQSERMGLDPAEVDAWSRSVVDAGGSADAFQGSLKALNNNIEMFKIKGMSRAHPFFEALGIDESQVKDVMELLPELSDKFSQLSKQEAQGIGAKMGLDEITIDLLRRGREETEKMIARQKEISEITKEDEETSVAYKNAMDELHEVMMAMWRGVSMALAPALTKLAHIFVDTFLFLKEHKGLIEGLAIAIGGYFVWSIGSAIAAMTLWEGIAYAAAAANAVMAGSFMIIPALIAAALAVFALAFDDIQNWIEGNDSMIGDWLGSWKNWSENVSQFIQDVIDNMSQLIEMVANFKLPSLSDAWSGVKHFMGIGAESVGAAGSTPLNSMTSTSIAGTTSNNTSVQIDKIEVQTAATDADGVASHVGNALDQHITKSINHFDNGVAR